MRVRLLLYNRNAKSDDSFLLVTFGSGDREPPFPCLALLGKLIKSVKCKEIFQVLVREKTVGSTKSG